jgi:hypothetical protein
MGKELFNKYKMPQNISRNANFECDLYFKVDELELQSTKELVSGAVSSFTALTHIAEDNLEKKWFFIEMKGPHLLINKLWQLECAVRLLPQIDQSIVPGSIVVLMNGDEKEANHAINILKIPGHFKILEYPVFVGWVPTRNIFNTLNHMMSDISELKSDISALKSDMNELKNLVLQFLQNQKK